MEKVLAQHSLEVGEYLQHSPGVGNSVKVEYEKARERISALSYRQFVEFSTDVCDEFRRRQRLRPDWPAYLQLEDDFPPKRNSARQKLAYVPLSQFAALVNDLYSELQRRAPSLSGAENNHDGNSTPSTTPRTPISQRVSSQDLEQIGVALTTNYKTETPLITWPTDPGAEATSSFSGAGSSIEDETTVPHSFNTDGEIVRPQGDVILLQDFEQIFDTEWPCLAERLMQGLECFK